MTDEALAPHAEAVTRALNAQGRAVVAAVLEGAGNLRTVLDATSPRLLTALRPLWTVSTTEGAETAYTQSTTKALDWEELVGRYVQTLGAESVRLINASTWRAVVAVLEAGLREGLEPEAIARELREQWGELSRHRALTIVRTEGTAARGWAGLRGAERAESEFGIPLAKTWVSGHDDRVRRHPRDAFDHLEADGQSVSLSAPFEIDGELLMHPGDRTLGATGGNVINCRCTIVYAPADTTGGDTLPGGARLSARSLQTERHAERNAEIRAEYARRVRKDREYRDVVLGDLARQMYLSPRQVRRVVDGA